MPWKPPAKTISNEHLFSAKLSGLGGGGGLSRPKPYPLFFCGEAGKHAMCKKACRISSKGSVRLSASCQEYAS